MEARKSKKTEISRKQNLKVIMSMKKKKSKKLVQGSLTNSYEKKRSKRPRRKGKIYPSECRISKNSKER